MGTLLEDILFFSPKMWTFDLLKIIICEQWASGAHCFILLKRQRRHAGRIVIQPLFLLCIASCLLTLKLFLVLNLTHGLKILCSMRLWNQWNTACLLYITERGLKNMHGSYNSYRSLLSVDMYAFYINVCAVFSSVCTIFGNFVTMYNRRGNCLTLCS
jgi:hypothetical protein